jgi:hypothetical protein
MLPDDDDSENEINDPDALFPQHIHRIVHSRDYVRYGPNPIVADDGQPAFEEHFLNALSQDPDPVVLEQDIDIANDEMDQLLFMLNVENTVNRNARDAMVENALGIVAQHREVYQDRELDNLRDPNYNPQVKYRVCQRVRAINYRRRLHNIPRIRERGGLLWEVLPNGRYQISQFNRFLRERI